MKLFKPFIPAVLVTLLFITIISACDSKSGQGDEQSETSQDEQQNQSETMEDETTQDDELLQQLSQGQQTDLEVSEKEMQKFVEISQEIRTAQQSSQSEMRKVVEDSDLGLERYSQIVQSLQSGDTSSSSYTDQEKQQFDDVNQTLQPMQQQMQQDLMQTIQDNGMKVPRFQQISMALRQDAELQQQFREAMEGQQE